MERERRSREYWEQELSEYWDSGLTVQEYCASPLGWTTFMKRLV